MKKHLITIAFILGAIVTLSVLLYPAVADMVNSRKQTSVVMSYLDDVAAMDDTSKQEMLDAAAEYNERLLHKPNRFKSTAEEEAEYLRQLDTGRGVMGVLEIDKIGVKLPIYHGTDEGVLQVGLGHMPSTSLPVGGAGTHAFITGHRGMPSSKLLTNLDRMAEGDVFILHILSDILTYQVDEIKTVLPDDAKAISIDSDADYCTLVTCTPYAVNTHRLLVRGHRIENVAVFAMPETDAHRLDKALVLPIFLLPVLLVLLVFAIARCIKISKGGKAK